MRWFQTFKIIPSLLTLLLLSLFVYLGVWQLNRSHEKKIEAATLLDRESSPILDLKAALARPLDKLNFHPVLITGQFLEEAYVLLDNQILAGQPGYQVFSVFKPSLEGAPHFLVNRGWIQANLRRQDWPTIEIPTGEVSLQGSFRAPFKSWVLNPDYRMESHPAIAAASPSKSTALRVQALELALLKQHFNLEFFPLVFRLSPNTPYTFKTFSQAHPFPYQKHLGYACQWFTMGALVVIYFLVITFRTNRANRHVST